jgi:flagellar protein FlaG
MDTLNAISAPPVQSSGLVQAPPKKDQQSAGSVTAAFETTDAIPLKLSEPKDLHDPETKQQISNAVKDINNFFQMTQRSLGFSMDEASGHMVMQIKDTKTNEVIRQIPGEDVLKLVKRLDDVTGVLFKAQA